MKASEYELMTSCINFGCPAMASKLLNALNQELMLADERRQELVKEAKAKEETKNAKETKIEKEVK